MQIAVAVEPIPLGGFRAESAPPFTVVAEGSTREEAVAKVRTELNKQLERRKEFVMIDLETDAEHPWLKMAGYLKDNPMFDEWQAAMQEYRRKCDTETWRRLQ